MKKNFTDFVSLRTARIQRRFGRLGLKTATTIALGTALSIGGVTESLQGVHFLVRKDLDAVRVVKQQGRHSHVIAKLEDGFTGNSVFKLSRMLPDNLVSQQVALFSTNWLPVEAARAEEPTTTSFRATMKRLNTAIRREFFASAVPFGDLIHEKAEKYDVDPALVAAVVETESRFKTRATSQVGARGLMQLMPKTGRWMGATNLYDPEQNVDAGVKYIKYLQGRFDGDVKRTIAAYNAGEGNVKRYGGIPPFQETRSYVKKVMTRYERNSRQLEQYAAEPSTDAPEGVSTVR